MVLVDGEGLPLGVRLESASPSEVKLAEATLAEVRVPRAQGRPRQKPEQVIADRGYDSDPLRQRLRRRGIELIVPYRENNHHRRYEDGRKLRRYKRRWIVSGPMLGWDNFVACWFVMNIYSARTAPFAYRVTIDLDPTDDPTHGAQQLSFFNGHYDTWCYLPVMGFVSFNDEAEQYLCAAVLRSGNVGAAVGAVAMLRRLVRMIRHHLPGVQIRVRLDGGFAHPAVLEFLEKAGVHGRGRWGCPGF